MTSATNRNITHADLGMQNIHVSSFGFEIMEFFTKVKYGMVNIHFPLLEKGVS
jgi:hypothetical protein